MKKVINDLKNKNLWSYILSFSAVVLFIVLLMGTYLYSFYYHTIYNDFQKSNQDSVSAVASRHENDMRTIDDIATQLSLAGSNVEFVLRSSPMKNFELRNMLYQYNAVSQFFDQILFFYHGDQYVYNYATSISVDRLIDEGLILENYGPEEMRGLLYDVRSSLNVLPEQKAEGYMIKSVEVLNKAVIYSKPLMPKRTSTVLFAVGSAYYDRLLYSDAADMRQTFLFHKNTAIAARGEVSINTDLLTKLWENQKDGQSEIMVDRDQYLVTWLTGESGIIYCTVQSKQVFQNKIVAGQWGILLVLAVCSIPTSLILVALARSLSEKVKNINTLLGTEEAYNLENLENGIRLLVESSKEMNQESMQLRRTKFISNLVRGQYGDEESIAAAARTAAINAEQAYYAVLLTGIHGNSNENEAHELMLRTIADCYDADGYGIHLIHNNQGLFVIFGDMEDRLRELFGQLFVIGKSCCEEFIMAVSSFHCDLKEVAKAYLEADSAYATRLLVDNSRIIYFGDVALKEQELVISDTYLYRLKNGIRAEDEAETGLVIQEICERLRSSKQSLLSFRVLCNNIIHMVVTELNMDETDFEDVYNIFTLSQCLTLKDFHDVLWEVSCRLMQARGQRKEEHKPDFVAETIACMKQSYQDPDFNMSVLAGQLGVSGVTLAIKFKNTMEISPSDYLTIIRMEQAKKLLRETILQVKEISIAVGYEDAKLFMRRFKKYTGKSPGQYRTEEK